jgi:hypothetical protein
MFRKPKQRNLRGRTDIDHSEDDQTNVSNTPTIVVQQQQQTVTTKTVIKKNDIPKSLLSFGDDEGNNFFLFTIKLWINLGDTEEFKVNKTRESRKMTKEVKKQQQVQNTSNDPKPTVVVQQTITTTIEETTTTTTKEENNNSSNGELEIKCMENKLNI